MAAALPAPRAVGAMLPFHQEEWDAGTELVVLVAVEPGKPALGLPAGPMCFLGVTAAAKDFPEAYHMVRATASELPTDTLCYVLCLGLTRDDAKLLDGCPHIYMGAICLAIARAHTELGDRGAAAARALERFSQIVPFSLGRRDFHPMRFTVRDYSNSQQVPDTPTAFLVALYLQEWRSFRRNGDDSCVQQERGSMPRIADAVGDRRMCAESLDQWPPAEVQALCERLRWPEGPLAREMLGEALDELAAFYKAAAKHLGPFRYFGYPHD